MLVPVGIAYAVASGVPGIDGLYATIVPLLAYALFGPSRILVLGPDSSLAAVILGVVFPLADGDSTRAVALAGMTAVVSGVVCVLAGVGRLGFVTELLSKPIRYGYMNGIALTVLISQLPKFFGFSIEGSGPLRELWAIVNSIIAGKTNWTAFAIGAATLAVILLLKNKTRFPGILVAIVGATTIVDVFDLAARANVSVLGPLPQGLPAFAVPWISYDDSGGAVSALVRVSNNIVLNAGIGGGFAQGGLRWSWRADIRMVSTRVEWKRLSQIGPRGRSPPTPHGICGRLVPPHKSKLFRLLRRTLHFRDGSCMDGARGARGI